MRHAGILSIPQVPTEAVRSVTEAIDRLVDSESLANRFYRLDIRRGWERFEAEGTWTAV